VTNPRAHLSRAQIERFIADGFVRIDNAFPRELADEARTILWQHTGARADDPTTWTKPCIRLDLFGQEPFAKAANTPILHAAFDQLVGPGGWAPRPYAGTFVIRFPSPEDPGDTGWHVDASFGSEHPDFMEWRVNVASRGRALLMLFLFSDVGTHDAPTLVRCGSHARIARTLAPAGESGLSLRELAATGFAESAACPEVSAVGEAGTVYLCHPFLVHAGRAHRGTTPRFLAQPPLLPARPFELHRADGGYTPVERAIVEALR
jgi:hypothetical protein